MMRLIILTCVVLLAAGEDGDVVSVPEDVLKFIIGCRQAPPGGQYAVPVHQTDINDATTSQHISLLSLEELRHSLKTTVHNEAVLGHILSQVEEAARTDQLAAGRSDCAVENHITIDIPPQEIDDFNDRVQMLMRQNTFLLLEQINTLFSFKLRTQKTDTEKYIKRRTNHILKKLNLIMAHLGIEEPVVDDDDGDNDDDDDDADDYDYYYEEYPTTTDFPDISDSAEDDPVTVFPQPLPSPVAGPEPVSEPVSEPEPEPESEPESEPEPEPETMPEPTARPGVVVQGSTEPGTIGGIAPTELFPGIGSISSSEEDEDDTESDSFLPPPPPPANVDDEDDDDDDGFVRTSQQDPSKPVQSQPIRTSQQQPILFHGGIGFIRPLARPSNTRFPGSRPTFPRTSSFQERMRLAAERRRLAQNP